MSNVQWIHSGILPAWNIALEYGGWNALSKNTETKSYASTNRCLSINKSHNNDSGCVLSYSIYSRQTHAHIHRSLAPCSHNRVQYKKIRTVNMHRKVDYSHNGIFCLVNKLIFVRDVCSFKMKFWQQIKFVDAKSHGRAAPTNTIPMAMPAASIASQVTARTNERHENNLQQN